MIEKIARTAVKHRTITMAAWVVLVGTLIWLAGAFPAATSDDYRVPGSSSDAAATLLEEHGLHDHDESTARVVLHDPDGLDGHAGSIDELLDAIDASQPEWEVRGTPGELSEVSADGRTGYLDITVSDGPLDADEAESAYDWLTGHLPETDGLQVAMDGAIAPGPAGGPSEGVGMLVAAIVLFIVFGSLLAMILPLAVALVGAASGVSALALTAHLVDMSSAATPLAAMIAVGVGIDYALLVVTRYREELAAGRSVGDAIAVAYDTAGRSVAFAGLTVIVAVLGLLSMAMPLISGVAVGTAVAVAMTMLAALTLLPALLALVGTRIDKLGLPWLRKRAAADAERRGFARWARWVQRHSWASAVGSLALLLLMAAPVLTMRLGFDDASALPTSYTQRVAHDLVADGFGPGHNGALIVAIDATDDSAGDVAATQQSVADAVAAADGVESISGPFTGDDERVAAVIVIPETAPDDPATEELVQQLRSSTLPAATEGSGATAEVTGTTAAALDYADYTQDRLPVFIIVVLAVSIVMLLIVFRSVLVPLKAALVNLLSIAASFGLVVAIVQWGWLADLLGFKREMPVTAWVPMMMVAVVFGLSMDYEVFLLSRIKERYDDGEDSSEAVAQGLALTGRVITAAALIMISVFGGFVLGESVDLKVFGLGLALAVLIDATIVRMVLVPAAMALAGKANWWLPKPLAKVLPRVRV